MSEKNIHTGLSINPNALGTPKLPYVLRIWDIPTRMLELYPNDQEKIIYVTSSFSWYNQKTKVAFIRKVGETLTPDELQTIIDYQDEVKQGFGETFRKAHTSKSEGVANHWRVITLLASLRKTDSFRDNLHNEKVMTEVINITKELLTHYLKFCAWWVEASTFAQEIAKMIADIKAGRTIIPKPEEYTPNL